MLLLMFMRDGQPDGGVKEGEIFLTALPESVEGPRLQAPTGGWKDGIFDCFNAGVCHPSLWCAICCPQCKSPRVMASSFFRSCPSDLLGQQPRYRQQ
jgi:hypothetical protein